MTGWACRWCVEAGRTSAPVILAYDAPKSDAPRTYIGCAYCDSLMLWPADTQRKANTRG